MSAASNQAAGLAVGAAVGSVVPGIGTASGASIGTAIGGLFGANEAAIQQQKLQTATLKLNTAQYHAKAAEQAAIHASNFRQALASHVSLAAMRGGTGSLATQFGNQAYKSFIQDQRAIELGVKTADAQAAISQADIDLQTEALQARAIGRAAVSAFDAINLNELRKK